MMNKYIENALYKFTFIFLFIVTHVNSQNNTKTSVVTYKISINNNLSNVD